MPTSRAPLVPAQRSAGPASLTQKGARSGNACESCGDLRLTEIGLTLTDGTAVAFVSCHHCEMKTWRRADGSIDLSIDTVLDHTRKPR